MTAGRTVNSESVCWGTPKNYLDSVRKVFGGDISLDPCSNRWSIVAAQTEYKLPSNDGLRDSWDYPTIFVNPPYGRCAESKTSIKHWIKRCADAARKGSEVIALIPVATNTSHWKDILFRTASAVCFLSASRVKFLDKGQPSAKGAPMACAVVYWGDDSKLFTHEFEQHGFVIKL
jgi:hypothetical protein